MPNILQQIQHIVVVMFENRSLDDMCGWLYRAPASPPSTFLPTGGPARFDGLNGALWNPRNVSYFSGAAPDKISVMASSTSFTNPGIDPEETFDHVTYQLYGPARTRISRNSRCRASLSITRTRRLATPLKSWNHSAPTRYPSFPPWLVTTPSLTHGSALSQARPGPIAHLSMPARQTAMPITGITPTHSIGMFPPSSMSWVTWEFRGRCTPMR